MFLTTRTLQLVSEVFPVLYYNWCQKFYEPHPGVNSVCQFTQQLVSEVLRTTTWCHVESVCQFTQQLVHNGGEYSKSSRSIEGTTAAATANLQEQQQAVLAQQQQPDISQSGLVSSLQYQSVLILVLALVSTSTSTSTSISQY